MVNKKTIKKSIKLIVAGCLVFGMIWGSDYPFIHADNITGNPTTTTPDMKPVSWPTYAKIAVGGKFHTALTDQHDETAGNLLSDTAMNNGAPVDRGDAGNVAGTYASSTFSAKEADAISSVLPKKSDFSQVYDPPNSKKLASLIPQLDTWWWTGEEAKLLPIDLKLKEREVYFADAVSPDNDTSADYVSGGTYTCVLPDQTPEYGKGQAKYTKAGCEKSTHPGKVPLNDFEYDGGHALYYTDFNEFTTQTVSLQATEPYTVTKYYDENNSLSRFNYDITYDNPTGLYKATKDTIQQFAEYIEFDYPTKKPCVLLASSSIGCAVSPSDNVVKPTNVTQRAKAIYYDTLLPVKAGEIIKKNTPIILVALSGSGNSVNAAATYAKFSSDMVASSYSLPNDKNLLFPSATKIERREFYDALDDLTGSKLPEVTAPPVAVRPLIRLSPSHILYFKDANSTKDSIGGSAMDIPVQFKAPLSTDPQKPDPVKLTIKDSDQHVNTVTPTSKENPNILRVDTDTNGSTIYVKPNTKQLNLTVGAKFANDSGTTSYITAIGQSLSGETVLGRFNKSDSIALQLDNLLATSTLGSKATVNLYTEELADPNHSDYIAEKPYVLHVVVAQDQNIAYDKDTQALNDTMHTYGDKDITIHASVLTDLNTSWDTSNPIRVSIDTTDPADADTAEVVSQTPDLENGKITAKIHLKNGDGGTDHAITINIDKPDSSDGKYLAAKQQQITLHVQKRAITISPVMYTTHVGDNYPPDAWPEPHTSLTSQPNLKVDGFIKGDPFPYTFTTVMINPDISMGVSSPPLTTNGEIKDTALDKKWGINLQQDTTGSSLAEFDKKYIPTVNDYQAGNEKSILQVKKKFDPMTPGDIVKQPQSVELQPDEHQAVFSTIFTYPLIDADGNPMASGDTTAAQYQDLDFQWYKVDAQGNIERVNAGTSGDTTVHVKMDPLQSNNGHGQMKFTLTIDGVQSEDNLSKYYCTVWNDMNISNPVETNKALLTMIQDPVSYVEVPQKIEISNNDKTAGVLKKSSMVQLRALTETDEASPNGVFDIQTDPEVKLYLNGDTTITDFHKIYTMKVLKADGTQVGSDKLLSKLYYPSDKIGNFTLQNDETDKKDWGKYSGFMTYTITYNPDESHPSSTSSTPKGSTSP